MVAVEDNQESGDSRRQPKHTGLSEYIRKDLSATVNMADFVLVSLCIPVKDTKINVGGCLVDVRVNTRGTEDAVNYAGLK